MKNCPNCQNTLTKRIARYKGFSILFNNKNIFLCLHCSMGYLFPQPFKSDIDNYNKNYFQNAHNYKKQSIIIDQYNHAIAKIRIFFLTKHIKKYSSEIKNVLEIGPGYGHLMMNWLLKYPDTNYFVDESDKSLLETLKSRGAFLGSNKIKEKKLDLVIISHVLEHCLNPTEFINKKTKLLKKEGLLFLEVPCNDYMYKTNYEPHTLFFDKKALNVTLINSGFKNINLSYHGETHNRIKYLFLIKKIIFKVSTLLKLPIKYLFINSWPDETKYNLNKQESESIILTSPHKSSELPSRWLRAIAQKV